MSGDDSAQGAVQILQALSDAIASGEPDRVLGLFCPDDHVTMFGSEGPEIAYGPEALEALWRRVLARGQSYVWRWRNERFGGAGDAAWVSAEADVEIDAPEGKRTVPYRATLVLTRMAGEWRICHYHGSEPADVW